MIHYTPEGHQAKIGLNVTIGQWRKPWIAFRWVWYDTSSRELISYRIRLRLFMRPFVLTSTDRVNVVDSWLWNHDHIAIPREVIEDDCQVPRAVLNRYKKTNYAEYVKSYRA